MKLEPPQTQVTPSAHQALLPFWKKPMGIVMLLVYFIIALNFIGPTIKALTPINQDYKNIYGTRIGMDASVYYVAGQLSAQDKYKELYDPEVFLKIWTEKFNMEDGHTIHFSYPPVFLFLVTPLSKFQYPHALALWLGLSVLLISLLVYRKTNSYLVVAIMITSPMFLWSLLLGQTGFLTAFLLGFGLYALDKDKPVIAGIVFGLLIIKPHLALALPLVLIYKKQWKVIMSGTATVMALIALSLLVFGLESWQAFLENFGQGPSKESHGNVSMLTIRDLSFKLTGSESLAFVMQFTGAVIAIGCLWWVWKNTEDYIPRLITLFVFPAFVSPYMHGHDFTAYLIIFSLFGHQIFTREKDLTIWILFMTIWVFGLALFREMLFDVTILPYVFLLISLLMPIFYIHHKKKLTA